MEILLSALRYLYPTLDIPQRFKNLWWVRERRFFKVSSTAYFVFFLAAYIFHYYGVDIPLNKEPIDDWRFYRFSCAAVALIGLVLTNVRPIFESSYYRVPIIIAGLYFTYFQGVSMVWREAIPYYYVIALPAITALVATPSLFGAIVFMSIAMIVGKIGIESRPDNIREIYSAFTVSMIFLAALKSNFKVVVGSFITEMKNIESEKEKIELIQDMKDQIKTFMPSEIFNRYMVNISDKKMSSLQAMDDVLRQRKCKVAVIMSDIRGYTQLTKKSDGTLEDYITPEIQNTAAVMDKNRGITRIIGDETFAYFDNEDPLNNIRNAIRSCFEIKKYTFLKGIHDKVERYLILSFGEAFAGNIGGVEGYRHITVQGSPANICSRIDPITKNEKFKKDFSSDNFILTESAFDVLRFVYKNIDFHKVDLDEYNFSMRDFPDEKSLFIIPFSEKNQQIVLGSKIQNNIEDIRNIA